MQKCYLITYLGLITTALYISQYQSGSFLDNNSKGDWSSIHNQSEILVYSLPQKTITAKQGPNSLDLGPVIGAAAMWRDIAKLY